MHVADVSVILVGQIPQLLEYARAWQLLFTGFQLNISDLESTLLRWTLSGGGYG